MTIQEFIADYKATKETVTKMKTDLDEANTKITKQAETITALQSTDITSDGKASDGKTSDGKASDEITVTDEEAKELEKLLNDF